MIIEPHLKQISILLSKARQAEDSGDLALAERYFNECVSLDDGEAIYHDMLDAYDPLFEACLQYARLLESNGDYAKSIQLANRALPSRKWRPHALYRIGQCNRTLKKYDEAETAYRKAMKMAQGHLKASLCLILASVVERNKSRKEEARSLLMQAIEIDPNHDEAHFNIGVLNCRQNNLQTAKEHLKKAIQLDPDYASAYRWMATVMRKLGDLHEARDCAERAIELTPESADAHEELGLVLRESISDSGDSEQAAVLAKESERHLQISLEINPKQFWSRVILVNLHWTLNKCRRAHEEGQKLVELFPESSVAHWVYGDFLASTGHSKTKAEALLRKAIELDDEDAEAYYTYGKALLDWDRWQEAHDILLQADKLGNKKALPLWNSYSPQQLSQD